MMKATTFPGQAWLGAGLLLALFALAPAPALAVGDPEPAQQPSCPSGQIFNPTCNACAKKCKASQVWDCAAKACVQKSAGAASDDELYAQAVVLIKEQRYDEAHDLLLAIKDRQQARVLNYIGFTTRKLGDVEQGIGYYRQALAIDPNYVKAREYLGEGFLQKGDVEAAKGQLMEIANRCGTSCEEYLLLADAIAKHLSGEPFSKTW